VVPNALLQAIAVRAAAWKIAPLIPLSDACCSAPL
jgi:hypothetical protein